MKIDFTALLQALLGLVQAYDQVATGGAKVAADKAVNTVETVAVVAPVAAAAVAAVKATVKP